MTLSPIALFVYNRPGHTKKTIDALSRNLLAEESDLYIFSDGIKAGTSESPVHEVREYIKSVTGFKSVTRIERETNIGLSANIIGGVKQLIDAHGKVIVLEDDLVTSPFFLKYMNDSLQIYEKEEQVISVHGYVYPVQPVLPEIFFLRGADCWGWATWKRGWDLFEPDGEILLKKLLETKQTGTFDFDGSYPYTESLKDQIQGKTNSWAIRWYASAFLSNRFTMYPGKSLVSNIGGDGTGTHNGFDHLLYKPFSTEPVAITFQKPVQNKLAYEAFAEYFRSLLNPSVWFRIKRKLNSLFKQVQ